VIGSVGIPNRYGGPEAFAENISPRLASKGFRVTVTCDKSRYVDDLSPEINGVRRVFIPINANGALSPLHDLVAFLRVAPTSEYVLVLGVSGGIFFPLFRLVCMLTGSKLLVNIDGVEWRRPKFGRFGKSILYWSDFLAQRFTHTVIYDNLALKEYVRYPAKAVCVEYSGDHALLACGGESAPIGSDGEYALTICRIEPENNCDVLIEGFLKSSIPSYVFVGNWSRSEYGEALRRRYSNEPRLRLLDPIYDRAKLFQLRSRCTAYLHGHSVGGTNPSLVEILFFDCGIYCWDCSFNRVTAGDTASYFGSSGELATRLDARPAHQADRATERRRYTADAIVAKLLRAIDA